MRGDCSVLQYVAYVLQCVAACCVCVAVCCSVLRMYCSVLTVEGYERRLQCAAVCCNMLQYIAAYRSISQCVAYVLQCVAVC